MLAVTGKKENKYRDIKMMRGRFLRSSESQIRGESRQIRKLLPERIDRLVAARLSLPCEYV